MRLKEFYYKEVRPKFQEELKLKNPLAVPRIEKIVVNVGIGSLGNDERKIQTVFEDITAITGQKPVQTKSKKSISGFKLKKGQVIGLKVTLRGKRMYDFLEKIIKVALPRTRDFKGVTANFDGTGNLTLGFKEQTVFPEIEEGKDFLFGFEATIVTTAKNDEEAKKLLTLLGVPFKKE